MGVSLAGRGLEGGAGILNSPLTFRGAFGGFIGVDGIGELRFSWFVWDVGCAVVDLVTLVILAGFAFSALIAGAAFDAPREVRED